MAQFALGAYRLQPQLSNSNELLVAKRIHACFSGWDVHVQLADISAVRVYIRQTRQLFGALWQGVRLESGAESSLGATGHSVPEGRSDSSWPSRRVCRMHTRPRLWTGMQGAGIERPRDKAARDSVALDVQKTGSKPTLHRKMTGSGACIVPV
jgi:hypothetical protein